MAPTKVSTTSASQVLFFADEKPYREDVEDGIYDIYGNFKQFYVEKETLGQGMSAVVKRCICVETGKSYAVKIADTKGDEELEFLVLKLIFHS